ncbi:complex I NDUFA9 subunit family protein [Sphingomonas sp. IC4-52]|uniref:complex I NDUFA9 subunit family protein n=1 Tax=Sphingomonas sp. IC4-52 TaxID=2887202 RepID=UPI001D1203B8|nr:complex I NDUFA9 subunit family protein [Sphingomonas sp. IC4-52]MCC2981561.1 complex I NDUFA9 subunit family protein [Sphingomonas sp. IC4-52]
MRDRLFTLIGGGGFLGRYVAQALLATGARVRVAQRDPREAWYLKPLGALGQTQFVAADITRPDTIERAIAGADGVVNLVGSFTGNLNRIHVEGPRALAQAARNAGVEAMVHVSAIGADPQAEALYAQTKGAGEAAVRDAFPGATILRPSTVFGREDKFINMFARMVARFPVVPVLKPNVRFQPVFAGDVGDAVATVLRDPATFAGRTFELGGPDVLTMLELQQWIGRQIGRHPSFVPMPDALGGLLAALPGAPISRDQWKLLQKDTVVTQGAEGLQALGITPTPLAAVAPGWLVQYQRAGRFARPTEA